MRLKFIEYIINAACCECRCERMMKIARFIVAHFEKIKTKSDADPVLFAKVLLVSRVASDNFELEPQSSVSSEQSREDRRDSSNAA